MSLNNQLNKKQINIHQWTVLTMRVIVPNSVPPPQLNITLKLNLVTVIMKTRFNISNIMKIITERKYNLKINVLDN